MSVADPADAARHAVSHQLLRRMETERADAKLAAALAAEARVEVESDSDEPVAAADTEAEAADEADESEEAAAARSAAHATRLAEFTRLMRERVLAGVESAEVDYAAVDGDASLDARWDAVADSDAQERWFEADE